MALTWLEIGLGNYHEALRSALEAYEYRTIAAVDVVEAGIRCGDHQAATAALESFLPMALATGNHITLGLVALGRALLADDDHAEPEYLLAIEHFQQCPLRPYLARSYLLCGEWLRGLSQARHHQPSPARPRAAGGRRRRRRTGAAGLTGPTGS